jgi:hypothetical protein
MSENLKATLLDANTGEVTERILTANEANELELMYNKEKSDEEVKIAARKSALAKLAALGLTEAEIAAL